MDEDYPTNPVESHIEEQLEIVQNSIWETSLNGHEVRCTKCSMTRHTKDYFRQE